MRILFASMPADGHFNPLTGIAAHLARRGHDIRWYAGPEYARKLEALGMRYFPTAGRRPATTLHAWMTAVDGGSLAVLGGTPGGDNQVSWNAQLLQGIVDGETSPGALVTAPRWEWLPADDGVRLEAGFSDADADALAAAAARAVRVGRWGLPCAQQVITVPVAGQAIVGAADPRTVGSALGV